MLSAVVQALRGRQDIADWQARCTVSHERQLYALGSRAPEAAREVDAEYVQVEVHHDHPAESRACRGSARVTVPAGQLPATDAILDRAVFAASLVNNPPYGLPGPSPYPDAVDTDDPVDLAAAVAELDVRLRRSVQGQRDIRLASAEFFAQRTQEEFANSRGAAGSATFSRFLTEIILVARDAEGAERETSGLWSRRRAADVAVEEWVEDLSSRARDGLRAVLPDSGRYTVVLSGQTLPQLFEPFAFHASGRAVQMQISRFKVGQPWGEVSGDPLTLYSNGLLPFGDRSGSFDEEGMPGHCLPVVEDNIVRHQLCTRQYADWLNLPATGPFANYQLPAGKVPFAELTAEPCLHLVDFSAFDADPITGDFVSEIRSGYVYDGSGRRPIRGGSVQGNVFDCLAAATYSAELCFLGNYQGPYGVRLSQLSVSGA